MVSSERLRHFSACTHGFGKRSVSLESLMQALSLTHVHVPTTFQCHGDLVHVVDKTSGELRGDGFITNQPGVVCFVRTADCVPLLLYDPVQRAVGALHAGWRGTAQNIAAKAVQCFTRHFGSRACDLQVAIGPAICGSCYEVGADVLRALGEKRSKEKGNVDLTMINRNQLAAAGVPETSIDMLHLCTACDAEKRFASYRVSRGNERQFSFITLVKEQ